MPPSEFSRQLQERVAQLNALLDLKLRALKIAPEGNLRISQSHGNAQYYHRKRPDDKRGLYIDANNYELAQGLAQKDYNKRLVAALKKELKILQSALSQLKKLNELNGTTETVLNSLTPLRRALIIPATLSDSQYAAAWLSPKYKGKPFQPDSQKMYTSNGERVRSKSEVLIADTLKRLGVPYRYEFPMVLKTGGRDQTDTATRSKKSPFIRIFSASTFVPARSLSGNILAAWTTVITQKRQLKNSAPTAKTISTPAKI